MNCQEYQKAVAKLLDKAEATGYLHRNVLIPDRAGGRARRVGLWIEEPVKVLVEARFRARRVGLGDIRLVLALGRSIGAEKCIVICSNGWTKGAERKASSDELDLRLITVEIADQVLRVGRWAICLGCRAGQIMMEKSGSVEVGGTVTRWRAGRCSRCGGTSVWCRVCGNQIVLRRGEGRKCSCGHIWCDADQGLLLEPRNTGLGILIR